MNHTITGTERFNRRILVIDDLHDAHEVFRDILAEGRAAGSKELQGAQAAGGSGRGARESFVVDSAYHGEEGISMVEEALAEKQPYSVAFIDIRMPGWDGVETTSRLWSADPELQVVLCSAYEDYRWEEITQRLGQTDQLLLLRKPFQTEEVLQLAQALSLKWQLARRTKGRVEDLRRLAEHRGRKLCSASQRLRSVWGHSSEGMRLTDREGCIVAVNEAYCRLVGLPREKLVGQLWPVAEEAGTASDALRAYARQFDDGTIAPRLTTRVRLWNSEEITVEISNSFIPSKSRRKWLLSIFRDTTERNELEQQVRQAQKMKAIGQLAGGVAHDFNNILAAIRGNIELALMDAQRMPARTVENLQQAISAADRAVSLISQLMTFGRKEIMEPRALDLNALVSNLVKMLERIIGEDIQLRTRLGGRPRYVRADPAMMEQVLVNLAVNARDAMPRGGKLEIATESVAVKADDARQQGEGRPGQFVCLSVSDSGSGIAAEHLPHIFKPYFTTKDLGKGTGLGLATVDSIVKEHQGWIEVASEAGVGSTFKVFLPASGPAAPSVPAPPAEVRPRGGSETILVVEDEESVREPISCALRDYGYEVLEAGSAHAALELCRSGGAKIDLLLADVVMPGGMTGSELAERLSQERPGLKVIFMSGYGADMLDRNEAGDNSGNFQVLRKPFRLQVMLRAVRENLDGRPKD
jgi:two-component system, cell cycle sensor histidine kinase and response regulator CckA